MPKSKANSPGDESRMRHRHVRRLDVQDLPAVVAVERRAYPAEMQEPESVIAARLRYEDEHYSSLNLGLYDDNQLVGYVLAHLDDGSEFPGDPVGSNVYVADLSILPEQRRHLPLLLVAFIREVRQEYPGLPVVAHSIPRTAEIWRRHEAALQRLGVALVRESPGEATHSADGRRLLVWKLVASSGQQHRRFVVPLPPAPDAGRPASALKTTVAYGEDGLLALKDAWHRMEQDLPGLTVFQTHRYLSAWARCFAVHRKLLTVCIHGHDGELIGIAPFQVVPVQIVRGRLHRELTFLGAPWEVDRPRFLFKRDIEACAVAVADALLALRADWDVIWFHEQDPADRALGAFCRALSRRGLLHGRVPSSDCPYLTFDGSWQQLLASKSQKFRKGLKASRRRLEAAGRLEYETCTGDEERLQDLFLEYEQLEGRSWKARKGVGVSQSTEHLRFYLHLIHEFADESRFVFRCLRLDGRLIAATFGIVHGRTYHSLHIAHDAAWAKYSPGTLLESFELEECSGAGLDEYDFLGGFLTNKVRWATHSRRTVEVHLYQRQPSLVAAHLAYFVVKPPLKRLLARCGIRWSPRPRSDGAPVVA